MERGVRGLEMGDAIVVPRNDGGTNSLLQPHQPHPRPLSKCEVRIWRGEKRVGGMERKRMVGWLSPWDEIRCQGQDSICVSKIKRIAAAVKNSGMLRLDAISKPEMEEDGHFNFQGAEEKAARMPKKKPYRVTILEHIF